MASTDQASLYESYIQHYKNKKQGLSYANNVLFIHSYNGSHVNIWSKNWTIPTLYWILKF